MIDAHRGAFEYDWRTRFNQRDGLAIVGTKRMSWGEALRQTERLLIDPSSHVAASVADWEYPISHEALVLMSTFDLQHTLAWVRGGKKGQRPKPLHRPWPDRVTKRMAPSPDLSQDEILTALRSMGHTTLLPWETGVYVDTSGRWRDQRGRFVRVPSGSAASP